MGDEHPKWPDGTPVLIGEVVEHKRHGLARIVTVGVESLGPGWVELSKRWYQPRRLVSVETLTRLTVREALDDEG